MCKTVYITTRSFDIPAREFKTALADELRNRKVEVVTDTTCALKRLFRKHKTYGMAIAIDFFRDGKDGCGLTLNKQCSYISRDFAYNISNLMDTLTPRIRWRDFRFVDGEVFEWRKFFYKISSETKAIFYLCTYNNDVDYDIYSAAMENIVKAFADEIIRCLRSNYDYRDYQRRVKIAKLKLRNK